MLSIYRTCIFTRCITFTLCITCFVIGSETYNENIIFLADSDCARKFNITASLNNLKHNTHSLQSNIQELKVRKKRKAIGLLFYR